eukprot:3099097-Prymnesium_polylepis.1
MPCEWHVVRRKVTVVPAVSTNVQELCFKLPGLERKKRFGIWRGSRAGSGGSGGGVSAGAATGIGAGSGIGNGGWCWGTNVAAEGLSVDEPPPAASYSTLRDVAAQ